MHIRYINVFDIRICYYHLTLLLMMKQNGKTESIVVSDKKQLRGRLVMDIQGSRRGLLAVSALVGEFVHFFRPGLGGRQHFGHEQHKGWQHYECGTKEG